MLASATPSPSTPRACPTSYWVFPAVLEGERSSGPDRRPVHHDRRPRAADGARDRRRERRPTACGRGARPRFETPDRRLHPLRACVRQEPRRGDGREHERHRHRDRRRGGKHVVWTSQNGISYAGGTDAFTVEQVYDYGFSLRGGPIGQASVTADGNPWVAYTVNASGQEVRVASFADEVEHADGGDDPAVRGLPAAATDPYRRDLGGADRGVGRYRAGAVVGARRRQWVASEVAGGVSRQGLDMAVDADGNGILTFFDDDGGVQLARQGGRRWSSRRRRRLGRDDRELQRRGRASPSTTRAVSSPPGTTPTAWCWPRATTARRSPRSRRPTRSADARARWGVIPTARTSSSPGTTWRSNLRFGVQGDIGHPGGGTEPDGRSRPDPGPDDRWW